MNVLAVNCGSSTLKFRLVQAEGERLLAGGIVDRIGSQGTVEFSAEGGRVLQEAAVPDHGEATRLVLEWLSDVGFTGGHGIDAVGHRVVHGGDRFAEPTLIDDTVVDAIEALGELAPLHNAPAISAIKAAREALDHSVPMVATFDTAFHRTMPERASQYAIPPDLAARNGVRRYGFHGLAHRYMTGRYAEIVDKPVDQLRLITLQLGAGCSAAAIERGKSIDTSMGFTPLEGLVMGSRCGDIDPSVVSFVAGREGVEPGEVLAWLNNKSGLLGVSGISADMRDLLDAERRGDERASLAVEMFCYRVRKYIGAYLAVLGGADAMVFGGGIGEHAPEIRARICGPLEPLGLRIDTARNVALVDGEGLVSVEDSPIAAHVVHVDEERIIARDTFAILSSSSKSHA